MCGLGAEEDKGERYIGKELHIRGLYVEEVEYLVERECKFVGGVEEEKQEEEEEEEPSTEDNDGDKSRLLKPDDGEEWMRE